MFRSWHGLFLTFTTLLLLLVMGTVVRTGWIAEDTSELVQHTDQVMGEYFKLRGSLTEMESTTHSFAMAHDPLLLERLRQTKNEAETALAALGKLTVNLPSESRLLSATHELFSGTTNSLREMVDQVLAQNSDQALHTWTTQGAVVIKAVLANIDQSIILDRSLQIERAQRLSSMLKTMNVTALGGVLLAVATGFTSFILLQRNHGAHLHAVELEAEKERAMEADAQKSRFLANMSHEIRTPMNAIMGFTDLLVGLVREDRAKEYVRAIQSSGRSLLDLINDVLDLSRIEAGKLPLRPEACDVRDIVEGVALMDKRQAEEKGIHLETSVAENVPVAVEIDALRFRQILLNLTTNAVKYTNEGGVKILVKSSQLDVHSTTCDLEVQVIDTGVGISKDDQERIFSAFEQVSAHSRSGAQGTGLGLSITRRLVELMKGTLTVASTHGMGSMFTVLLPDLPISQDHPIVLNEEPPDFNQLPAATILIVDDNGTNRDLIAGYLYGTHHRLLFAANGLEAVETARNALPGVILMDIRMPRMDGKTARRLLSEDIRTHAIPVIAQTASSMPEEAANLRQTFDGYLQKPFLPVELFRTLQAVLGQLPTAEQGADSSPLKQTTEPGCNGDFASWPALASALKSWNNEEIPRFIDSLPMLEIAEFAERLDKEATRHDCPPLRSYARALLKAAKAFELDQVEKLLRTFPLHLQSTGPQFAHR